MLTHEQRIVDALRERYQPLALAGEDVSSYVSGRRLEGLEPDPAWLHRFDVPPEDEIRGRVSAWLRTHSAREQLDEPAAVADLGELRQTNYALVEDVVDKARVRVAAWCRLNHQPVPPGWSSVPAITVRGAIEGEGIADLIELDDTWVLERSAQALGWPAAMARTLVLDDLGMSAEDLSQPADESTDHGKPQKQTQTIDVAGRKLEVGVDHLAEIANAAHETIDDQFLNQKGTALLGEAPGGRRRGGGGSSVVVARMSRMTEEQRTAIGLVGEVVARAWLERRYQGVRWRSGYAAIVAGDPDGSDACGYDFEAPYRNTSLYFEVKSMVDVPRDLTEFELGESEVRAAQECAGGDRYRILLVTAVLEPAARQVFVLPSPFSKKGAGRFRVVGRGLRYRCQLS